ncbi:MAG: hypothetical protein NVS9B4_18910 [Candidatus Acidiferrum sp.]
MPILSPTNNSTWRAQSRSERLYRRAPVWAQNLGISLYGLSYRRERLGGVFGKSVAEFRERDRWDTQRMQNFLQQRLREVLAHAFSEVPYYRTKWTEAGLQPGDVERFTLSDLPAIPVTSKRDLAADPESFLARDITATNKIHRYFTSGSTGTPIASLITSADHQRFVAARQVRSFGWAGASVHSPRATIGGRMIVADADVPPPYYRYNWPERQIYFSAFHISPHNVVNYLAGFHKYQPQVLTGYAHSYYTLARMMLEQGLRLNYHPDALVLSSETLTAQMKTIIREAFGARAYEEYGSVENCALATECEAGRLHVNSDFGIVEIVDDNNLPVPAGTVGRIVCTGLLGEAQPLIRYDLGDLGTFSKEKCSCGRDHLPLLQEIVGRAEDVIVARDGREIVRLHGVFINLPNVLEGQIIQEALDSIRVRVVTTPEFSEDEEQLIHARLRERVGMARIAVERVREIARTERGKFRAVLSLVHKDAAARSEVIPRRDVEFPADAFSGALPAETKCAVRSVSIIAACRNEINNVRVFLDSVLTQDFADFEWEVIVADGESYDGTKEVLQEIATANPRIKVIDNPLRHAAAGLNAAIRLARGEIILRMDAHTEYAPSYVKTCVETLLRTGAQNVGGPARTKLQRDTEQRVAQRSAGQQIGAQQIALQRSDSRQNSGLRSDTHQIGTRENDAQQNILRKPELTTVRAQAIQAAVHSKFSTGGARFHDDNFSGYVDTVPYGCWRRETLRRLSCNADAPGDGNEGPYDETLVRNQDDELNLRLIRSGGKIWQSPDIISWYQPRAEFSSLLRQYFQYGYWKVAVIRKHKIPSSWRQLVPGLFVATNICLPLLALVARASGNWALAALSFLAWIILLAAYAIANITASMFCAARYGWRLLPFLPVCFGVYHFSYGAGFLLGLIRWPFKRWQPRNHADASSAISTPTR